MSTFSDGMAEVAVAVAELTHSCGPKLAGLTQILTSTLAAGGTVFLVGNGGNAALAQHLATEFVVKLRELRRPFPAMALTTDTSLLTAAANDMGFEQVFARQVEALCKPGDLLWLFSASGVSPNLLRAAQAAQKKGVACMAFLGRRGGPLYAVVRDAFLAPADDSQREQELHLIVGHLMVVEAERLLL